MKRSPLILVLIIFYGCTPKQETLAEHFKSNQEIYEQLKTEISNISKKANTTGLLTKPEDYNVKVNELLSQLPLDIRYISTSIQYCDSTPKLELELIFDPNIYLNFSECQENKINESNSSIEVLPLTEHWFIWREKDFI